MADGPDLMGRRRPPRASLSHRRAHLSIRLAGFGSPWPRGDPRIAAAGRARRLGAFFISASRQPFLLGSGGERGRTRIAVRVRVADPPPLDPRRARPPASYRQLRLTPGGGTRTGAWHFRADGGPLSLFLSGPPLSYKAGGRTGATICLTRRLTVRDPGQRTDASLLSLNDRDPPAGRSNLHFYSWRPTNNRNTRLSFQCTWFSSRRMALRVIQINQFVLVSKHTLDLIFFRRIARRAR